MKIICVDNFDRDYIPDRLICENVSQFNGERIVKLLNDSFSGDDAFDFYKLVPDDHKLFIVTYE